MKSFKELFFFVILSAMFYGGMKMSKKSNDPKKLIGLTVGFTFLSYISYIILLHSKENFWDVSPAAKCKSGNWYNWQGSDPISEECRALSETEEGQCEISAYSCPNGYNGTPKIPFVYSNLSNDDWHNERCDKTAPCSCTPHHDEKGRYTAFVRTAPF